MSITKEFKPENSSLSQNIADALVQSTPPTEITVSPPIPEHIAKNLLVFLQRVQSTGMEAVAWVEAHEYLKSQVTQPGVPFTGLPPK